MKLKEINRTAIQSWSPAQHHPVYLATGTSAQQLDASFSTNASLEFFELDLAEPSLEMKSCGSFSSSHRYHKLVWGPHGMDAEGLPSGVLVAGGENGDVILYDPAKIIAGESDVIIAQSDKHTGPVRALDVNPFQTNLVASGGNESEIYIWDMNNFGSPMTPGPKTQPLEDISCVAWNRQVQHILASASPSGRASVWDLRKNDLIIKVSDHSNRMHCSGLAWNPEVATQLVVSSEDDRLPVIQMWDLRFATSPLKILENHTRGVLSIAWSLADPELLLSCGKDNRILCWNPNTAEVLYELPTSSQWCFDIQWCPRNPAVLSAASFDGHIDIYSIMGGNNQAQTQRHADQISTSFGNMDPFGTGQTMPPLQLPQTPAPPTTVNPLKKPPKWIRRPVGASFAFGGKLVSLENAKPNPQQPSAPVARVVHVSQVVTETALLKRSDQLQATLGAGSFVDFCQAKIEAAESQFEKTVWSFLKANFDSDVRSKYLELLGYNKEELALKISAALEEKPVDPPMSDSPAPASLQPIADPSDVPPADTPEAAFDMIAAANLQPAATDTPEAAFDMIAAANLQPEATGPPKAAFEMIAAETLQPEATHPPEAAFDTIATVNLQPVATEPPEAVFDTIATANLQPASTDPPEVALHTIAAVNLQPFATDPPEALFDMIGLQTASTDPPEAAFDMIAAANLQPASTDLLEASFDTVAAVNLQPVATDTPEALFDMIGLQSASTDPPEAVFDTIAAVNLQPAATDPPEALFDMISLQTASADPPEAVFDAIAAVNLQPLATDLPEAVFDTIAAANLQPVATLDLESIPDPETEEPATVDPDVDDNTTGHPLNGEPEPNVDQVLTEEEKVEEEIEDIPLEEDMTEPLEVEITPAETLAPDEEPTEVPAPAPTGDISLSTGQDVDGLITQALLTGDFEGAVELCLHDNRMADSIILAIAGGAELLEKTQKKYFTKTHSKITKLISAVVTKDWQDILKTCDLHSWKEALAAVMTYARPDEFSSLCDLLGDRLEAALDVQLQAQACLCYICAGNVEKLVSCWTRAQDGHCPLSLQDLVEKVVVLRRAVEQTQRSGPSGAIGILLAEKMSHYANLLASQGSLTTAISYLPDNTNQVAIQQLRDRLSRALGHQQAVAPATPAQTQRAQSHQPVPQAQQPIHQAQQPIPQAQHPIPQAQHPIPQAQHPIPQAQHTTALPRHPYMPGPRAMVPQPTAAPVPAPAQPRYYQPLEPPMPMYGTPPSGTAAGPPPSSNPAYISHQYQPYPQVNQYPPGAGGVPLYQPLQYSSAAHPPPLPAMSSSPPQPPGFLSQYVQPVPSQPFPPVYPGPPPVSQCLSSSPPSRPPFFPNASSSFSACPSSGASYQHGGPGSPVSYMPLPPPTGLSGPQNGWNDPPALSRAPKKKQVLVNYTPPAPIMAPLGGDPQAQPAPSGAPQPMIPAQPGVQAPYSGMHQQQFPPQAMNPAMPKTSMEGAPGAPTGDVIQSMQSIPAEKIMKKPIPEEHMVLKTTFEGLIHKCLAVATDPQTKRKLDDANKRLEALYDKLREQTLSPAIVAGLHNMARSIESRSYTEGLNIHTHIVSSSNFSETSAFMPVLKVVLTQANKLGV
ncbi:protein transport protein Sec31A isoform X3 [Genypterus blacodes]|uniref:protein transport protein Sec31A isoform X3 n=1 Tax=Genypterus blacodes TaxID=154954 RepID=UPI003F758D66